MSHTLPASGIHLRPTLDSSAGHKSLKHNSSAGPDALYHPSSDYMELDNKAEVNSLSSMNTLVCQVQYVYCVVGCCIKLAD